MTPSDAVVHAARFFDGVSVRDGMLTSTGGGMTLVAGAAPAGTPRLDGLVTGRFTDHHVHLQLVDHTLLAGSRLGTVVDLGADPGWIRALAHNRPAHNSGDSGSARPDRVPAAPNRAVSPELRPRIRYAGPFLTAVGGYPSDRAWAPAGSVREIADADDAARAVEEAAAAGASIIKVVAHSEAGAVLDDDAIRAIVHRAAEHRLPVVAHAEGRGQAQRVVRLGVTVLAHAPFSERLTDDEIAAQAASATWISTMAIHDDEARVIVTDNMSRFAAAGGVVVYGSDMGNGPMPVDLREVEINALRDAGVDGIALLTALAPADPLIVGAPLLLLPDDDPNRAHHLTTTDLEH